MKQNKLSKVIGKMKIFLIEQTTYKITITMVVTFSILEVLSKLFSIVIFILNI